MFSDRCGTSGVPTCAGNPHCSSHSGVRHHCATSTCPTWAPRTSWCTSRATFPDFFCRLLLPEAMWPWFILGGITAKDFAAYMESAGTPVKLERSQFCLVT